MEERDAGPPITNALLEWLESIIGSPQAVAPGFDRDEALYAAGRWSVIELLREEQAAQDQDHE